MKLSATINIRCVKSMRKFSSETGRLRCVMIVSKGWQRGNGYRGCLWGHTIWFVRGGTRQGTTCIQPLHWLGAPLTWSLLFFRQVWFEGGKFRVSMQHSWTTTRTFAKSHTTRSTSSRLTSTTIDFYCTLYCTKWFNLIVHHIAQHCSR